MTAKKEHHQKETEHLTLNTSWIYRIERVKLDRHSINKMDMILMILKILDKIKVKRVI